PHELGLPEPFGDLPCDAVDELPAAQLEQLGSSTRDHRDVLAPLGMVAGERTAVEEPVCVAPHERTERRAHDRPVEEKVDADDGRVLEPRLRFAQKPCALGWRYRNDDSICVDLV